MDTRSTRGGAIKPIWDKVSADGLDRANLDLFFK
jgi:hypothetical protein